MPVSGRFASDWPRPPIFPAEQPFRRADASVLRSDAGRLKFFSLLADFDVNSENNNVKFGVTFNIISSKLSCYFKIEDIVGDGDNDR